MGFREADMISVSIPKHREGTREKGRKGRDEDDECRALESADCCRDKVVTTKPSKDEWPRR